jgi:hypothetical protein
MKDFQKHLEYTDTIKYLKERLKFVENSDFVGLGKTYSVDGIENYDTKIMALINERGNNAENEILKTAISLGRIFKDTYISYLKSELSRIGNLKLENEI